MALFRVAVIRDIHHQFVHSLDLDLYSEPESNGKFADHKSICGFMFDGNYNFGLIITSPF